MSLSWCLASQDDGIIGSFYVHWAPTPLLYEIEADEGFSLEDLQQELGPLKLKALGRVKHGDVPHGGQTRGLEEEP